MFLPVLTITSKELKVICIFHPYAIINKFQLCGIKTALLLLMINVGKGVFSLTFEVRKNNEG